MPITGPVPAQALATARKSAKDAVLSEYKAIATARGAALTAAEQSAMKDALDLADATAILTFITTNAVVVGTSVSGGPVTGTVT